jgi:hypothetical protein
MLKSRKGVSHPLEPGFFNNTNATIAALFIAALVYASTFYTPLIQKRSNVYSTHKPNPDDFIIAMATNTARHALVKATRNHRWGLKTYALTNLTGSALDQQASEGEQYNEAWEFYPDISMTIPGFPRPVTGEWRLAMTPFKAHRYLQNNNIDYKWILYGDDDTVWFIPGAMEIVANIDPDQPWMLTDNYFSKWAPGEPQFGPRKLHVPRCIPCHLNTDGLKLNAMRVIKTCNCTTEAICSVPWILRATPQCNATAAPIEGHNGGGGMLMSRGLFNTVSMQSLEDCMKANPTWLGDHAIYQCIWRAGIGQADPGWVMTHPGELLFDALDADTQNILKISKEMKQHMVSVHLSAGKYSVKEAAAMAVEVLQRYEDFE